MRIAAIGSAASLLLFVVHVLFPADALQLAAFGILSPCLVALWIAVLAWRVPVFENRVLLLIGATWSAATMLAVWIVLWTQFTPPPTAWRLAAQAFAMTLSLAAAGLFLRALLRKRTSPLLGRLLSLLSPLALLLWIVVSALTR
jgi:hypothetical protein